VHPSSPAVEKFVDELVVIVGVDADEDDEVDSEEEDAKELEDEATRGIAETGRLLLVSLVILRSVATIRMTETILRLVLLPTIATYRYGLA
jgi:hypothetical protein